MEGAGLQEGCLFVLHIVVGGTHNHVRGLEGPVKTEDGSVKGREGSCRRGQVRDAGFRRSRIPSPPDTGRKYRDE